MHDPLATYPAVAPRRRGAGAHAAAVGAVLFTVTAAVNLQVPLYTAYAAAAGLGTGPTALMFGAYVGGLLPVLMGLGGISDRMGRKPVLAAGLVASCLATLLMILRPEFSTLFAARLLQGAGVGLSVGTGTAYLAELPGMRGSEGAAGYAAVTTSLGFGSGALFTAGVLFFGHTLAPLSYGVVLAAGVGCLVLVGLMPAEQRAGSGSPGGRAPLLRLPSFPAGSVAPGLAIAAAWAVTGLVIAVVPAQLARGGLAAWSGPALFLVNGCGALCQPWARRMGAHRALRAGLLVLPAGYALLVVAAGLGNLPLLLLGAGVAGSACYGFTYLGGLAEAARLGGAERARAVSGFLLCAYLGFGIPPAAVGFLADRFGTSAALAGFGAVLLLAHAALWTRLPRGSGPGDLHQDRVTPSA